MKCKFCFESKKLIKAHAIPESFFRLLRNGGVPPKLVTNTPGVHPKKSPIGVYDEKILCADCEKLFNVWDDYAYKLLILNFDNATPMYEGGRIIAYRIENIDYTKLKLFSLSVLWRASISSHSFYSRVSLGPYNDKVLDMIKNNYPEDSEIHSVILTKFDDPLGGTMPDPVRSCFSGVNFFLFYLGGFVLYVKVDKRPTPQSMKHTQINQDQPLIVAVRVLKRSSEFKLMKKFADSFPTLFKVR